LDWLTIFKNYFAIDAHELTQIKDDKRQFIKINHNIIKALAEFNRAQLWLIFLSFITQ
jgi:hypothetical protein